MLSHAVDRELLLRCAQLDESSNFIFILFDADVVRIPFIIRIQNVPHFEISDFHVATTNKRTKPRQAFKYFDTFNSSVAFSKRFIQPHANLRGKESLEKITEKIYIVNTHPMTWSHIFHNPYEFNRTAAGSRHHFASCTDSDSFNRLWTWNISRGTS